MEQDKRRADRQRGDRLRRPQMKKDEWKADLRHKASSKGATTSLADVEERGWREGVRNQRGEFREACM